MSEYEVSALRAGWNGSQDNNALFPCFDTNIKRKIKICYAFGSKHNTLILHITLAIKIVNIDLMVGSVFITAHQRSCGKVIFSHAWSQIPSGGWV